VWTSTRSALDPELTELGLKAIAEGFADGTYMPLPVTTYRAGQISKLSA
jgi:hypothetical protein